MKKIKKFLLAFALALSALVASIAIGLGIIHLTNFIYYIDIDALNIPEDSGYPREQILENVSAVMEYLDPFSDEAFHLPDFDYSESGASHFADCKVVFGNIYLFGAISFIIFVLMLMFLKRDRFTYRTASLLTLALPGVVGIAMAVNFDKAFVIFHELLFDNSDWIFDPATDPIIKVLPPEFFMHCGVFIALCVIMTAFLLFLKGGKKDG